MQHLSAIWADVLAWAAILAGVVACAALIVRVGDRRRAIPPVNPTSAVSDEPAPDGTRRLGQEREWALVVRHASQGLDRSETLAALHASAALKIAAAEHALDRLVADYADLCELSAMSAAATPRNPAARRSPERPDRPAQRRPLAA